MEDESFRQKLLDDPRGTVEQELGTQLPEGVKVRVEEETAETIYLVLPSSEPIGEGGELSDQDLEAVAGGGAAENPSDSWSFSCADKGKPGN
jgi:hypothetical protein